MKPAINTAAAVGAWLAVGAMASGGAKAQPVTTPAGGDAEDIVVTGTLLSRQRAIDLKRKDFRIIDALGTDELGQFPDKNVGESLNRLPGVSMLVEKGEGRYVQIRGIAASFNHVTINGIEMGSPETELGGRQAPLDIIAGSVLGRVEVVKTRTPDMDGQGIGGAVNAVTRMPFDVPGRLFGAVTARIGYESERPRRDSYGGHDPYALDGLISLKNQDDSFGVLLGGSWSAREYVAIGIYQDDWDEENGEALPINVKNNYYIIGRKRLNLNGALEWRPDAQNQLFVRAFHARWDEFQHRNRFEQNFTAGIVPDGPSGGVSGPNRVAPNIRLEDANKRVTSIAGGGRHDLGLVDLDWVLQYNKNSIAEPNDFWEWRSGAIFGPNSYSVSDRGIVTITPDAGTPDRLDPTRFPLRRARFTDSDMRERTITGRLDANWETSSLLTLKAGAKASRSKRDFDFERSNWNPGETPLTLGTDPSFTRGGFVNETPEGSAPNILMDIGAMNRFFDNPANAGAFVLNESATRSDGVVSDYRVRETVLAGYGMARLDLGFADIVGGLRVEHTDVDSSGFLLNGGTTSTVDAGGSYTSWLPSLIGTLRPTETVVLRAAITRALGRPGFNQISPRSQFNEVSSVVGRLSVGNPGLRARESWNYDLSAEWYPDRFTSIAVALFHKDIANDFLGATESFEGEAAITAALAARGFQPGQIDVSGLGRLDVSTTINAGSTFVQGIELSGQVQLAMLPAPFDGFGLSGSATFIKGRTRVNGLRSPVQDQPTRSYAFSLFYQKAGFDASASYAFNNSFPTDLNSNPDLNLDQGAFGRWDARIAYNFGPGSFAPGLRIFVEGVNLNNEPTSEFQGGRSNWNTEYEFVGRTFYLGVGYSF